MTTQTREIVGYVVGYRIVFNPEEDPGHYVDVPTVELMDWWVQMMSFCDYEWRDQPECIRGTMPMVDGLVDRLIGSGLYYTLVRGPNGIETGEPGYNRQAPPGTKMYRVTCQCGKFWWCDYCRFEPGQSTEGVCEDCNVGEGILLGEFFKRSVGKPYQMWMAMRDDGCAGYFQRLEDVPPEFKDPQPYDIGSIMRGMRTTDVGRCLRMMNSHWQ